MRPTLFATPGINDLVGSPDGAVLVESMRPRWRAMLKTRLVPGQSSIKLDADGSDD
jgi:hypothetical protein